LKSSQQNSAKVLTRRLSHRSWTHNTPAQSSFLDATKAQPMTGAIKTLGEAAPQEFQGYGAVIKSASPTT